jgi:hypothetical protein
MVCVMNLIIIPFAFSYIETNAFPCTAVLQRLCTVCSAKCDVIVLFINLSESGTKFVSHLYLNEEKISRRSGMKPCARSL